MPRLVFELLQRRLTVISVEAPRKTSAKKGVWVRRASHRTKVIDITVLAFKLTGQRASPPAKNSVWHDSWNDGGHVQLRISFRSLEVDNDAGDRTAKEANGEFRRSSVPGSMPFHDAKPCRDFLIERHCYLQAASNAAIPSALPQHVHSTAPKSDGKKILTAMDSSPADSAPSTDELDTALRALIGRGRFMAPQQRKRLHDMATQANVSFHNKQSKTHQLMLTKKTTENHQTLPLPGSASRTPKPNLRTRTSKLQRNLPHAPQPLHTQNPNTRHPTSPEQSKPPNPGRESFNFLQQQRLRHPHPPLRLHLPDLLARLHRPQKPPSPPKNLGLLDFFRWCVHSTGTEKLVFHVDVTEWNEENLDMGQYKDINEPGCAMYETSEMLLGVIELAKNTAKSGKFTEARIRRDFTLWVGEEEYECRKNSCEMTTTSVSRVEAGCCTIVNGRANCDDNLCKSCPLDKKHRAILKAMQHQEGGCQSCGSDSTTTYERCDDCGEEWETSET
ncbi:uncharacterized protein MYCFIDRAFT_178309 [Pseudocercospora fijiensis CIRAD86]|uniref:Uncharacterized protein n=1 Tax=Pseudocercospora fijiensis (strain CIRAD86) TaxID=383855 RepID=M3ARR6_PSEFD|nr:uncharacterized protein MYCFIDRAFT_178309 [Pseudocercospora fijiensis CIRAD86]EME79748.1 hypothetical protein MYCFIDRAFT_178309 [Pseudocercospora fijiensis CIRAD86]